MFDTFSLFFQRVPPEIKISSSIKFQIIIRFEKFEKRSRRKFKSASLWLKTFLFMFHRGFNRKRKSDYIPVLSNVPFWREFHFLTENIKFKSFHVGVDCVLSLLILKEGNTLPDMVFSFKLVSFLSKLV